MSGESEELPRVSPDPCSEGCPGWDVFETGPGQLEIQRCDECWAHLPSERQAFDADFQGHPVCVRLLERRS